MVELLLREGWRDTEVQVDQLASVFAIHRVPESVEKGWCVFFERVLEKYDGPESRRERARAILAETCGN